MTLSEFDQWLTYHRAKFTCLTQWFEKINKRHAQDDTEPSFDDTMTSWFRTLRRYDLADATRATDMMGVDVPEPAAYDRHKHPMVISEICRKLRGSSQQVAGERKRRYIDGEEVFECLLCKDEGLVEIWTPYAMRAARDGQPVHETIMRTQSCFSWSVRCTCKAANQWPRDMPVFNPDTMLPYTGMPFDRSEEPADLLEFVVGRGAKSPEFAQHSGEF